MNDKTVTISSFDSSVVNACVTAVNPLTVTYTFPLGNQNKQWT